MSRSESHVELSAPLELSIDHLADRERILAEAGYVPAIALRAAEVETTSHRDAWWAGQELAGEYGHSDGAYRKFPQNWVSGRDDAPTRAPRIRYGAGEVTLRMPSVTGIKSFEATHGDTFDVPVSANYPDADVPVQGWVRVTREGDRWHATGVGFPGDADVQVAEAVSAVLEARRPRIDPRLAGDMIERRREREASYGSPIMPVDSGWIEGVGFDAASQVVVVATDAGRTLGYMATRDVYEAVARADSPGSAYNALLKRRADRAPVQRCGNCGRFSAAGATHACPVAHNRRRGLDDTDERRGAAALASRSLVAFGRSGTSAGAPPPRPAGPTSADPTEPHTIDPDAPSVSVRGILLDAARRPLAGDPAKRAHGRRGWTLDLAAPLQQFTSRGYVPSSYSNVVGGGRKNGDDGVIRFDGAGVAAAAALYARTPASNLDQRSDGAPTLRHLLGTVKASHGSIEFGGAVTGPGSLDEGVEVSALHAFISAENASDAWVKVAASMGVDPDLFPRPWVVRESAPWRGGAMGWTLTW